MKKIFTLIAMFVMVMTMNAQIMKIYKGNEVVATYTSAQADKVVFEDYEYVDLGLPSGTLWATCNVGADKPEDYGDYFAWGETTGYNSGKTDFAWSTYKWCNGSSTTLTKYCTSLSYGTVDSKIVLEPSDDVASVNWGGNWHIPTFEDFEELFDNCIWTWTTVNSVCGYKIVSKTNDNSIFLPAAGGYNGTSLKGVGTDGNYWTSSLRLDLTYVAYGIYFLADRYGHSYDYSRRLGRPVRPVYSTVTVKPLHEYVDLGLSVKWATCNVGAENPEDYGDYFAWGETTGYNSGKTDFSEGEYKWESFQIDLYGDNSHYILTKYNTNSTNGKVDDTTVLESSDDAATANWGTNWRMPTKTEFQELIDNCTWTWTTQNSVNGYKVTSKKSGYTDKSIFIPASGYRDGTDLINVTSYSGYWSSSLLTSNTFGAYKLNYNSSTTEVSGSLRYYGRSIRPVLDE